MTVAARLSVIAWRWPRSLTMSSFWRRSPPPTSTILGMCPLWRVAKVALVCGRRWGKTSLLATLAVDAVLSGRYVGAFIPTYKLLGPLVSRSFWRSEFLPGISVNRTLGEIKLEGGGAIDLWSLDHTARAGRGRKYHLALISKSAHDEGRLADSLGREDALGAGRAW